MDEKRNGAEWRDIRKYLGRDMLLADGSTGTALQALIPEAAERVPLLPLERPDVIEELHRGYFAAGSDIVETATFTASAEGLARFADGEDPAEFAYRVNLAAAQAAVRAAREAEAAGASGRPKWVAGSMGPGGGLPSMGFSSWAELRDSYLPQARGLADGGVDFAIVETSQDPLQVKAALAALAHPDGGRGLKAIVSATVESSGRLLAGTSPAAFVAIIAPFEPLAIGMNCSGGPDELARPFAELAERSPFPLCFMPNAGLPIEKDGRTGWPLGPDEFAAKTATIALRHGVAIVGGCCGTGVEHIRALGRRLAERPRPSARPARRAALASLYEAKPFGPGVFAIGGEADAGSSPRFAGLLDSGDFDALADSALEAEASGVGAVRLRLGRPGRDEAEDLRQAVSHIAQRARTALCLDTDDPEAAAAALPFSSGRVLLRVAGISDPGRARRVFDLAREHGAAVVCPAAGAGGPARSAAESAAFCLEPYLTATRDYGLGPESLFLELPVAPAVEDPDGTFIDRLTWIAAVKAACPGALVLFDIRGASSGLPESARQALEAVYLELALGAGLDAAIVGTVPGPAALPEELLRSARELLLEKGQARQRALSLLRARLPA
jgi:5-methyltetrahydrofolate--homocysteine methyltransferase